MTTSETPKHRWPVWPWLVLTVAGVVITTVAAFVGTAASSGSAPDPAAARVTVTATQFETTTITATVTVSPPPPSGPAAELADGLHAVGVDVQPGTYQTPGPSGTNAGGCYWSRTDTRGRLIDNGVVNGAGVLTVNANELVETAGCQPWQKVA